MPVTKDAIADAAIASDIACDALIAAIGSTEENDARAEHDRLTNILVALITEYRHQAPQPESPPSVEPRV